MNQPWKDLYERTLSRTQKNLNITKRRQVKLTSETLLKAFSFAYPRHEGALRKNGDTLWSHVVKTLEYVMVVKPDEDTITLVLLHELVSLERASIEEIEAHFGKEMAHLVDRYEQLKKLNLSEDTPEEAQKLRQMFVVLADDVRVILVKLASRLHSLETIDVLPKSRQLIRAKEALEIYGPIASRLGVYALKVRIEDVAFRILRPKLYKDIKQQLDQLLDNNTNIIDSCKLRIRDLLKTHRMKADVVGRIKSVYSIARKMQSKGAEHVEELFDIFAIRVLVHTKEDCYRLFGYIHEKYPPVPHRIKDYIALPKANNYQSLHTTVTEIYEENPNRPIEVQIRSFEMNEMAEFGIASHSGYKEGARDAQADHWKHRLAILNKAFSKKGSYHSEETSHLSRLIDQVFVLTPQGEVKSLKAGATPLDFAYSIHTDLGHQCTAAKVNGKVVPLSYTLQTGDEVEVVKRLGQTPTATSLLYAKTPSARAKIRTYLHASQKSRYLTEGRRLVDKELQAFGKPLLDSKLTLLEKRLQTTDMASKERLLIEIGKGSKRVRPVIKAAYPDLTTEVKQAPKASKVQQGPLLLIDGKKGIPYTFAKCCLAEGAQNIDRSKLRGYLTLTEGVKIHKASCISMQDKSDDRILTVS